MGPTIVVRVFRLLASYFFALDIGRSSGPVSHLLALHKLRVPLAATLVFYVVLCAHVVSLFSKSADWSVLGELRMGYGWNRMGETH